MKSGSLVAVDEVVSGIAWLKFPGLLLSVRRWVELAGDDATGLSVSAVPVGMDYLSVRVTLAGEGDDLDVDPHDWIEWLMPMYMRGAGQWAIDHFAERSLDDAACMLTGRRCPDSAVADFPVLPTMIPNRRNRPMPKKAAVPATASKTKTPSPAGRAAPIPATKPGAKASAAKPAKRSAANQRELEPAPISATRAKTKPATKRAMPMPTATATATATAPRAETRSGPARPAKRATSPAPALPAAKSKPKSAKPASTTASARPARKPRSG